jgi:mono/diheme cytochrome c family protein
MMPLRFTSMKRVVVRTVTVIATTGCLTITMLAKVGTTPPLPSAQAEKGVYTAAQQKRGATIYNRECSTCHGETLKGGEGAPAIAGPPFWASYGGQTVADLFDRIRQTMPAPPEQPGKLTPQEYADVVAHILSVNGLPAGDVELPADVEQLKRFRIPSSQMQNAPTFTRDVAPIFYRKCVTCHRPGESAPMSLLTYRAARPWASAIRRQVAARTMPPWFADPAFSRRFANDNTLSAAEISTLVDWVEAGAPEGDGEPPAAPVFTDEWHTFNNRPPDAVIEMPAEFDVPAEGVLPVFTLWSPNPFHEDKFLEAVELRPGIVAAVHHSDVTARSLPRGTVLAKGRAWKGGPPISFVPVYPDGRSFNELTSESNEGESVGMTSARRTALSRDVFGTRDDNRLLFYVPGGGFQRFPPGAVKRISAGNVLAWNLHYTPTGQPARDKHRLGLWFAQTPQTHEVITKRIGEAHIIEGREFVAEPGRSEFPSIPAFADDWRITAITPFQDDVTLYGLWPHMHLRGKDMTFIATYPDGREEVLLHVPEYDFRWQLQYELVTPVRLPAGSTIKAIGHYDNSSRNPANPAPGQPVYWSEQTADEMFNGWMELSVDAHVIAYNAVYALATPLNDRVSLAVSSGPPGTVYVRNADGAVVRSGAIGAAPSFIEPWTFRAGQTVTTAPAGADSGTVTLTMYDVPPDVNAMTAIGGPAVAVTTTQPGQNGLLTFSGAASQRIAVHVVGNRIPGVTITLLRAGRETTLAAATSSAATFNLPALTLPSSETYAISIDPQGVAVGTLNIAVTSSQR